MASDCRDRYRNHIQNSEDRTAGPWRKEEEIRLTQIVTDMTVKQGKDMDNDVFWSVVSQRMGGKRGRQQCRIKWYLLQSRMLASCTNGLQDGLPKQNFQEQRYKTTLEFARRLHPRSQVNTADMSFRAETRLTELQS
jgi:hypothetical protein